MNCPNDGQPLGTKTISDVEIEECPTCHGMWFAGSELRQAKDEAAPDLTWMDFDLWLNPEGYQITWSERKCPVCGQNLVSMEYNNTSVTIDYCKEKHGVFLDQGEFECILAALEDQASSMQSSEYVKEAVREARDMVAGGESFASDWHDFWTVIRLMQYRVLAEHPRLAKTLVDFEQASPFNK